MSSHVTVITSAVLQQLLCDNQSALQLIKQHSAGQAGRSKHIDVQYHFLKHRYQVQDLKVAFVSSTDQRADMLTKSLPGPAFDIATQRIMGS